MSAIVSHAKTMSHMTEMDALSRQNASRANQLNAVDDAVNDYLNRFRDVWAYLERLERHISITERGEITIKSDAGSVTLKKNGDITIKGHDIRVQSDSKLTLRASGELDLKGAKILQN